MEMTQEWINQFNKKCAEFMGYKLVPFHSPFLGLGWKSENILNPMYKYLEGNEESQIYFHSDWNWIMEVVEQINELPNKYDGNFSELNGKVFSIKHMMFHEIIGKKESIIQVINRFIDWYNTQTQL